MTENKLFECQEMFRHACTFCECADMALNKFQHDSADIGFYTSPAIVNSAFACEVFMKTIVKYQGISLPKSHKLYDLYQELSPELREWIKQEVDGGYPDLWTTMWGKDYLEEVSNAFVEWRYSYEHDWSKSSIMHIELGFLNRFRDALREACCRCLFAQTWETYRGERNEKVQKKYNSYTQ